MCWNFTSLVYDIDRKLKSHLEASVQPISPIFQIKILDILTQIVYEIL